MTTSLAQSVALTLLLLAAPGSKDTSAWEAQMKAGHDAFKVSDFATATAAFSQALVAAEKIGPEDLRVAASLNFLAHCHRRTRGYAQTVPLYKRALAIERKHEYEETYRGVLGFAWLELVARSGDPRERIPAA